MKRGPELALTFASILLSLALAEVVVRTFYPQTMGFSHHTRDGLQVHVPNARGVYRRQEFETDVRFNSMGLRGGEFAMPKPEGTYRIVALGDSFTAGLQVDEEDLFTTRIEQALSAAHAPVEVLNLGVSGYGTDDELILLRRYGAALAPDLVLVFFFVGNDVHNNLLQSGCTRAGDTFLCEPPEHLSTAEYWRKRVRSQFAQHSHVYQLWRAATERERWRSAAAPAAGLPAGALATRDLDVDLYLEPEPEYMGHALALTGFLLGALRRDSLALGADVTMVLLPTREQVEEARWQAFVEDAGDAVLVRDRPQRAIRAVAAEADVPVIDLLPELAKRAARGETLFWHTDAHLNAAGHAAVAEVVAAVLAKTTRAS
jgi:lysophospholipase L1-like esterase